MSTSSPEAAKRHYLMIGAPVTTVRTPPMLVDRLAMAGIEATCDVMHVEPHELDGVMATVRADPSIDGMMVTMPHKRAMIPHLSSISETARRIGSVNAVKRLPSGDLVGAQFDGVALVNALQAAGVKLETARILQFGMGGAGTAIALAIMQAGCRRLCVHDAAMDRERVRDTLAELARGMASEVVGGPWNGDSGYDLLINATPLGMKPDDPSPFTGDQLRLAASVADIVADPPQTRLAELARDHGAQLVTGRQMVAGQIDPIATWLLHDDVEQ